MLKLIDKYSSADKTVVYLVFESNEKIDFQAGQFLIFERNGLKRAYSIASSPFEQNLWFYIKKASENGMSKYLVEDMKIWETIKCIWPFWHMVLKESENYLFISTWTWIAPILSIFRTLKQIWKYEKIVNIFWERYEKTLISEVINELKGYENEKTKNCFFLSKDKKDGFYIWYVQEKLQDAVKFVWKNNLKVYICWKPIMVDDVVEKLINIWIDEENILFEKY